MKARDVLTLIGTVMLTLGPELQTEGGSSIEWRIGRYMRIVGAVLIGSRAVMKAK